MKMYSKKNKHYTHWPIGTYLGIDNHRFVGNITDGPRRFLSKKKKKEKKEILLWTRVAHTTSRYYNEQQWCMNVIFLSNHEKSIIYAT